MAAVNWRRNKPGPGPQQGTQALNVSFADWNGASKGSRTPACNFKPQGRQPSAYGNQAQPNYNHQPLACNFKPQGRQPSAYGNQAPPNYNHQPPRNFKAPNARSRASDWNAQKPEVLFNDHSQHLLKHEYRRGMIINAPVHEAMSTRGKSRAPSHYESISAWGGVFTKPRYLIVIALHEKEYTCIPLYSHNREGLRGKEHYRNEFVSVRDGRLTSGFTALSDHEPLVTELATGPILDPDSTAWLTHPVSRNYDLNLSVCGRLRQESLDRLVGFLEVQMKKGLGIA